MENKNYLRLLLSLQSFLPFLTSKVFQESDPTLVPIMGGAFRAFTFEA